MPRMPWVLLPCSLFRHVSIDRFMGCFPLIFTFALGTGIGYAVNGPSGALWGAGIGLLLGIVSGVALVKAMRRGG